VISPLAKGNAYASNVAMNHSSDIATMDELFGLGYLNNPIQANAQTVGSPGSYSSVGSVNDLSSLFVAGAVPEPTSLGLIAVGSLGLLARRRRA
jgi:hypothetical protein